jgi:hypothetical protein
LENNFLVTHTKGVETPDDGYVGTFLSEFGVLTGKRVNLSSESSGEMGISADGRILMFDRHVRIGFHELVIQRLNLEGHAVGKQAIAAAGRVVFPRDISNVLSGNRRFVLYSSGPLFIQVISNGENLANIGSNIRLPGTFVSAESQVAAIDPDAHFLIHIAPTNPPRLMFQALDALGSASGAPRLLATGASTGLDILKDAS